MSRKRKNAGEGYGFMFSGAFSEKKDAVAKEKKRKGSFIKGMPTKHGYRYVVMTPRTNPIKRKKKPPKERENSVAWGKRSYAPRVPNPYEAVIQAVRGGFKNEAEAQRWADEYKRGCEARSPNPSELLVMGANPHENVQEVVLQPGSKLIIRNNPAYVHSDDSRYMLQAAAQLYPGRHINSLNARELSQVAMLAARLKVGELRGNSLGTFLGFSPRHARKKEWKPSFFDRSAKAQKQRERLASEERKRALRKSRQEFRERVREKREALKLDRRPRGVRSSRQHPGGSSSAGGALRADVASALVNQGYKPAQAKRMAREASGTDFSSLFHDALRQNPLCGAMVQGYACTRKPGHKGPHLPQGATMRTRHRLPRKWQPNPSAEALREKFTGAPVEHVRVMDEPHMPAGNYAMLGKLLSLYVKPRKGGQVQEIRAAGGTMVVSDESARQIYFVGGDQDISSGLAVFGAVDRGAGLFEIGEARRLDYRQRKEHVDHPEQDSWRHELGEENGIRPTVLYDSRAKRLLLEGGDYRIEAAGIIN
jgi:hypothetical protein